MREAICICPEGSGTVVLYCSSTACSPLQRQHDQPGRLPASGAPADVHLHHSTQRGEPIVEIFVQIRSDLAGLINDPKFSLRWTASTHTDLRALADALASLDVDLLPLHPGSHDALLQTYFVLPCGGRDAVECERIAATLRHDAAVQDAYVKRAGIRTLN